METAVGLTSALPWKHACRAVWIPASTWNEEIVLPTFLGHQVYLVEQFVDIQQLFVESKVEAQTCEGEVAYLFVSAYHDLYRQYVLDILASPRDFTIRIPYLTRWLSHAYGIYSEAAADSQNSEHFCRYLMERGAKPALIVFTDERVQGEPRRASKFLPIRTAVITMANLHGKFIQIELRLLDYVRYNNSNEEVESYHQFIQSLPFHPRLSLTNSAYVSLGPTYDRIIHTEKSTVNDDRAWESVVRILCNLRDFALFSLPSSFPPIPNPFEHAMFFRVSSLRNIKTKEEIELQENSGFALRSNAQYTLGLVFYAPKHSTSLVRRSSLEAKLSPETAIKPIGQTQIPLNFSYDVRNIAFATPRTYENLHGSISFSIVSPSTRLNDEEVHPIAPAPIFLVSIGAERLHLILAGILFLIGSVMASLREPLSAIVVKMWPALPLDTTQMSFVFGALGSLLTTVVMLGLYRSVK